MSDPDPEDDELDGCDVPIRDEDATPDDDLPVPEPEFLGLHREGMMRGAWPARPGEATTAFHE